MSKKFINFGAGWLKTSEKGNSFISVVAKSKDKDQYEDTNIKSGDKTRTRLWLQVDDGEPELVSGFCVFPTDKQEGSKGPDYRMTFIRDEG
jgi:uncharacterized protein (DUF736 family)